MWVKVLKDWDWRERPTALVAYKAGNVHNIPKRAFDEAPEGVFEMTATPKKNNASDVAPAKKVRTGDQSRLLDETDPVETEVPADSSLTESGGLAE